MYAIIKEKQVVGTASSLPNIEDLNSRGASVIFIGNSPVSMGSIYENGEFTNPIATLTQEKLLQEIRRERDILLLRSDKYMLPDYPTGELTREQWITAVAKYRQELREFPEVCNIDEPIFPTLTLTIED